MVRVLCLLLAATPLAMGLKLNDHATSSTNPLESYTFAEFVGKYVRSYKPGSVEWADREKVFNANLAKVIEKSKKDLDWKPGVNRFLDWTLLERKQILGYKPAKWGKGGNGIQLTKSNRSNPTGLSAAANLDMTLELPESHDWSHPSLLKHTGSFIRDQGACGSCWAVSTASVMEAHLEKDNVAKLKELGKYNNFQSMALSSQSLVSCAPNPDHCGGSGGCDGSTSPLAFKWIKQHGMPWGMDYQYTSGMGDSGDCDNSQLGKVTIDNWVDVERNNGHQLMQAMVQKGPVVLSVAANSWFDYSEGIFEPESYDSDVNHAVGGFGFGTQGGKLYWLIKNSWGPDWGEKGFIRLKRYPLEHKNGDLVSTAQCAMDTSPQDGDACEGENDPIEVCGNCAILYAASYPVNVHLMDSN